MKRQRGKAGNKSRKRVRRNASGGATVEQSRRDVLLSMRNWAFFALLLAAGGLYLVNDVRATIAEHDLSRIGNGVPAVVQIHDPTCPSCLALQKQTRDAMAPFGENELQYLVANIRNSDGRSFAAAHGVGHVTLLLFDGRGDRRQVLRGNQSSQVLAPIFRSHADR